MNKTKLKLKNIIKEELRKILKEDEEQLAAAASKDIAKKFTDLVKAQDLLINKIEKLKTKRSVALEFYKEVKMDAQRVGPAIEALKSINDEIKEYESKLTSVRDSYDQAIASSTEALDAKKAITKSREEDKEDEEIYSDFGDEVIF